MIKNIPLIKVKNLGREISPEHDVLAIEEPLEIAIQINGTQQTPISVTMRTPGEDENLAIGFLFTEGIISSKSNLGNPKSTTWENNKITILLDPAFDVNIDKLKRNFYTTSSCGVCGKESIEAIKQVCRIPLSQEKIRVNINVLFSLTEKLKEIQSAFQATGGIHASGLFDLQGNLLKISEDVGRHNALDKLIGSQLLQCEDDNFELGKNILLLSGRASFELIQKAAMAGIPIICAIGAPSSLAVETAESFGITLIGFLKNDHCNIYCGEERIVH